MNKHIVTFILAIVGIALIWSCKQKKAEKVIYELPASEQLLKLERQEKAYRDSLEKYTVLGETSIANQYYTLYRSTSDSCAAVLKREADEFMKRMNKLNP